ncbi:NACHT domain-containing protein [Amycolatopsis vastitatis]|uniref:NACHT domain-containing protein n=1 Tax=Amycolatopsis vastitatis TaxID=1905142 RepID=A0A229SN94_9PSEU|nr:NACHT domain-containing protein [Amycolatopsis vastitatis]OXM60495.1 hypothetical protein CF165_42495 [Amycolatopsis vastitatis]
MDNRRDWSPRRLAFSVSGIALAGLLVWLGVELAQGRLGPNDKVTTSVGILTAFAGLAVSAASFTLTLTRGKRSDIERAPGETLDTMADILAMTVGRQWENEERIRRVHDPFPLPVQWSNADDVADHWENVRRSPADNRPISLAGRIDEIVEVFNRVPSGRLVILGRAGAGKTVLMTRFVRRMLVGRGDGNSAPIPVVFSMGTWDPLKRRLRDWLVDELLLHHPALAARHNSGVTIAAALLSDNRVLPLLDGFDEMPLRLRGPALLGLNADLGEAMPVILTSRPDEYRAAVLSADVLTGAAVVEISDLDIDDVAKYLVLATPRGRVAGTAKWNAVLESIYHGVDPGVADIAAVLTTPLMVSLARTCYCETDADPVELLAMAAGMVDEERRAAIEDLLFGSFVPAAYGSSAPPHDTVGRHQRWLCFIARQFAAGEVGEIAWWRLADRLPRLLRSAVVAIVTLVAIMTPVVTFFALPEWLSGARYLWLLCGVVLALIGSFVSGAVVMRGHSVTRPPEPSRIRLRGVRLGRVRRSARWRAALWGVIWLAGGLVFGSGAAAIGLRGGLWAGIAGGLGVGTAGWLILGLVSRLAVPLEPTETISPGHLLTIERRTTLARAALSGLAAASTATAVVLVLIDGFYDLVTISLVNAILLFVINAVDIAAAWFFFFTAWGPWMFSRSWFAIRGELPWSTMSFLEDAHVRGVLRQAGGVYQFRHARLRQHLAQS